MYASARTTLGMKPSFPHVELQNVSCSRGHAGCSYPEEATSCQELSSLLVLVSQEEERPVGWGWLGDGPVQRHEGRAGLARAPSAGGEGDGLFPGEGLQHTKA